MPKKATSEKKGKKKEEVFTKREPKKVGEKFAIKELKWKGGEILWSLAMSIGGKLDDAHTLYTATLSFDERPYLNIINGLQKNIMECRAENVLFDDEVDAKIARLKDRIEDTENTMKEKDKNCPEFFFGATVMKIDWTAALPKVLFLIEDSVAAWLNEHKKDMGDYQINLVPVTGEKTK